MSFLVELWEYVVIFTLAAIPWIEIAVVIPIGIAAGLSPFWVTAVAFIGNWLPVLLIIVLYEKWQIWRAKRRERQTSIERTDEEPAQIVGESTQVEEGTKKGKRAQRIWNRYGLPGLALLAPAITGIHLAAVMALALKSSKRATLVWMTISLVVWAVGMGLVSYYGLEWFDFIKR
ncbi:hypothetical protein BHU72_10700 [Desulfuribacillus stibiiarsenatis]|uniref:Small multi-drug export protein n=1 Tax=Desulfuribacillus stibiiarsenatis TaxID=1390249 RepID=A0A1E5L2B6_9FIRM|nr:small multi-drug export protein [Desulfuribacillus stibiiarsenatis]OEH84275.1 hypothetical protein BHU72_10700 [Desulfuribacillus stibiiarsenatis]